MLQPQLNGGGPSLSLPTLYVSGQGSVYAYDLGAGGDAAPVSTTGGYYYQSAASNHGSIAGIATDSGGNLVVLQNYHDAGVDSCLLAYVPARTGPNAASVSTTNCNNTAGGRTTGTGVGITFTGPPSGNAPGQGSFAADVDVLMHYRNYANASVKACDGTTTAQFEVDRYQVAGPTIMPHSCVMLDRGATATYNAIAGSTNGVFFVDDNLGAANVERYNAGYFSTNSGSIPGPGPLAVSANYATNAGYRVVASTTGGITTIYSFKVSGPSITFTHALGTFPNAVGALAVDNDGTIYVGVNQPNGVTKVKVYGPAKTESTDPDYVLNNPVRRPHPAASPAAAITGIAISQQNAAPVTPAPQHLYLANIHAPYGVLQYNLPLTGGSTPNFSIATVFQPTAVALDGAGNLGVGDFSGHLKVFTAPLSGSSTPAAAFNNGTATRNGQIAFASDGDMWAGTASTTVNEFTPPFSNASTPAPFSGNGTLASTRANAFDAAQNLYIANYTGTTRLVVYAPPYTGAPIVTPGVTSFPSGIAISATQLFLSLHYPGRLDVFTLPITATSVPAFSLMTGLSDPAGVALDASGNLYVANFSNSTVAVYTPPMTSSSTPSLIFTPPGVNVNGVAVGK